MTYGAAFIGNACVTVKIDTTINPSLFCLFFLVGKVKETDYMFVL
jgi:hypothetical protein